MQRLPAFITRNFRLKALSIGLALVTWGIVAYAANPPDSRSFTVTVPGEPTPFVLVKQIPALTLRATGTREHLDAFNPDTMVTVDADFTAIRGPGHWDVPLKITNSDRDVSLDNPPSTVPVDVDLLDSRTIAVGIDFTHAPPAGFAVKLTQVQPASVVVSGPKRLLTDDLHASVRIDLSGQKANFTQDHVPIALLNGANVRITNLSVSQSDVSVLVEIEPTTTSRSVPVLVQLVGVPAPGHSVTAVTVTPATVVLHGSQELLNTIDSLSVTVNVFGMTTSQTQTVTLSTNHPGVTTDTTSVTVRITVTAQSLPSSTPTPTVAPTPTPTPTAPPSPSPTA